MTTGRSAPRCPKCGGRLGRQQDRHGVYISCGMCGYLRDVVSRAVIDRGQGDSVHEDIPQEDTPPLPPTDPNASPPHDPTTSGGPP